MFAGTIAARVVFMVASSDDFSFARLAVDRGALSQPQIDECLENQKVLHGLGMHKGLHDVAVDKKLLSRDEAEAILAALSEDHPALSAAGYRLKRTIGSGSMGDVYLATQLCMDRDVALKILPTRLAGDREFQRRFMNEAKAMARLSHPNIVAGIEVGEADGRCFFTMEYVRGQSLSELIRKERKLPEARSLEMIRQVALAIEHAAEHEFVHRDIKPANILIEDETGAVKVTDFGIVKCLGAKGEDRTQVGQLLGSPHFMSPEQASGRDDIDVRADLYGTGATLFNMVTGKKPFDSGGFAAVVLRRLKEDFPDPAEHTRYVSDRMRELILRLTHRERDDRYQTPREFIEDIDRAMQGQMPQHAKPARPRPAKPAAAAPPTSTTDKDEDKAAPVPAEVKPAVPRRPSVRRRTQPLSQPYVVRMVSRRAVFIMALLSVGAMAGLIAGGYWLVLRFVMG